MSAHPTNDKVRASRAGDDFHYAWAARQCLRLLHFNTTLSEISIEGASIKSDDETIHAGEYIIDVGEYHHDQETDELTHVIYHQLKHSTDRLDKHFVPSELQNTFAGFAERYQEFKRKYGNDFVKNKLSFSFISNRLVDPKVKDTFQNLQEGKAKKTGIIEKKFLNYTGLSFQELQIFSQCVTFNDSEGNYLEQHYKLRLEISPLLVGDISKQLLDSLVSMVKDKALPHKSDNPTIKRENVLNIIGVSSLDELFPAKPMFEELQTIIPREQEDQFLQEIIQSSDPVVIHAPGGVGKSVLALSLCNKLPEGSIGIIFDCFAAGSYRNPISPRHEHRQALVQIANELAAKGLCEPLLPSTSATYDQYLRFFMQRVDKAIKNLQEVNADASIIICIDAADNAEMAAAEKSDVCFAHQLIQQDFPKGTHLVSLCRTERKYLLKLTENEYTDLALKSFSNTETKLILEGKYSGSLDTTNIEEFHRLSGGNPRVQANALDQAETLEQALEYLGPHTSTVDDQINHQLETTLNKIKHDHPDVKTDLLCSGLASLPPFIPIKILASIANIDVATIKSFAADMGRPLWLIENSLQFRDEPTETWFKDTFEANQQQLDIFIEGLKPLTIEDAYAAECLPSILLKAQHYEELIELALSDDFLPDDSPIDRRNVQLKRLEFALKAALKKKDLLSVAKLALRAGEETAGNQRQLDLLSKNIDLIPILQPISKVQELAFQRQISGTWRGSENVYSASLLSHIESFNGEAKGYLRGVRNWLAIYFEERDKKQKKDSHHQEALTDEDIVELATSHMNIFGNNALIEFFSRWSPKELGFRIASPIVKRLIDHDKFDQVDSLALAGKKNPYFLLAVAEELADVGKFPPKECIESALVLLTHKKTRVDNSGSQPYGSKSYTSAYIAIAEAALFYQLESMLIIRLLKIHTNRRATYSFISDHDSTSRSTFLKPLVLIHYLTNTQLKYKKIMPKEWENEKTETKQSDVTDFKEIVGKLTPWLHLRYEVIDKQGNVEKLGSKIKNVQKETSAIGTTRYKQFDPLPDEVLRIRFNIITLSHTVVKPEIKMFQDMLNSDIHAIRFPDRLRFTRIAFRHPNLDVLRSPLEQSCFQLIESFEEERPEEIAEYFITLARAVLPIQQDDAQAYFDEALDVISKFGDEGLDRWQAVNALGGRASSNKELSPSLAYRFARCSEVLSTHNDNGLSWYDATKTLSQISPVSAFSVISRLRDRNVINYEDQLAVLTQELVSRKILSASSGWALTGFNGFDNLEYFADSCIDQTTQKETIFNMLVKKVRLESSNNNRWQRIKIIADKYKLHHEEIATVLDFNEKYIKEVKGDSYSSYDEGREKFNYDDLLADLNFSNLEVVDIAHKRFFEIDSHRSPNVFWKTVIDKIPNGSELKFINTVINSQVIDIYDIRSIFSVIPDSWWNKVSVKRCKENIFKTICHQHSASLIADSYSYKHHLKSLFYEHNISEGLIAESIIQGLVDGQDILQPRLLFSLVKLLAQTQLLNPDEAEHAFEYALARFEIFIEDDHAGGIWNDSLLPPEDLIEAYTGTLWATLASPHSKIRWQAAHCICQLAELGCKEEITHLISWVGKGRPDAFIDTKLPFYELHAQLYLLIALARIAVDNSNILLPHADFFSQIALERIPHILIRHFAAKAALFIEKSYPSTFLQKTVKNLELLNRSPFDRLHVKGTYSPEQTTPWQRRGIQGDHKNIHFGWDFDRYWFEPLGRVFGITQGQVGDIIEKIIREDWKLDGFQEPIRDPRYEELQQYHSEQLTRHSHGSYPKSDKYSFYYSYHAMFWAAGKLLKEMPVVEEDSSWKEDEWSDWIDRHTLTLHSGYWLSDIRNYEPLVYREWFDKDEKNDDWRWQVEPSHFLEVLTNNDFLNIAGNWSYARGSRKESISISSALVATNTSESLLRALQSSKNKYQYALPYENSDHEINDNDFIMEGWLSFKEAENRFDEYDPFAEGVSYPSLAPASFIQEFFLLSCNPKDRQWLDPEQNVCFDAEIWSNGVEDDYGGCKSGGNRLKSSFPFVVKMLASLNRSLIIEANISRKYCNNYRFKDEDYEIKYPDPYTQLFLLDSKGKLRTLHTSYELGEIISKRTSN